MVNTDGGLWCAGLRKSYPAPGGERRVLDGVGFRLAPGEALAVMGPSGSGKSTLLNLLGALDVPDGGELRLDETDVCRLDAAGRAAYRNRQVGFVFQDHLLLPQCTVRENVLLPMLPRGVNAQAEARVGELLARVGLADRADSFPAELSGGERQRVAIARALMGSPRLLLCDEPTGNLDRDTGNRIGQLLRELLEGHAALLVLATHNRELADGFGRLLWLPQTPTEAAS